MDVQIKNTQETPERIESLANIYQPSSEKLPLIIKSFDTKLEKESELGDISKLRLDSLYFKTFSREKLDLQTTKEQIKDSNRNIYVLLHGWTGTHEIFDSVHMENGKTIVEEIMETDPTAIIITPDGNGFGETKFDKSMGLSLLSHRCKPEDYAEQMQFILHDLLGITDKEKSRLHIMGHSMGGAATLIMAGKGYVNPENCVAVCPAALPNKNEENITNFNENDFRTVRAMYAGLAGIVEVGHVTKKTLYMEKITDAVVENAFEHVLAGPLMGQEYRGTSSSQSMRRIITELKPIHRSQARDVSITSAAMMALDNGVHLGIEYFNNDSRAWRSFFISMDMVPVVAGQNDILAPVRQFKDLVSETSRKIQANSEYTKGVDITVVPAAGHYATLYETGQFSPTKKLLHHLEVQ